MRFREGMKSMNEKYEVINTTSIFARRIGRKEATKIANEITLSFKGPRGRIYASFHPEEIKELENSNLIFFGGGVDET